MEELSPVRLGMPVTYSPSLRSLLEENTEMLLGCAKRERELGLSKKTVPEDILGENKYRSAYERLIEYEVPLLLVERKFSLLHFARLTDYECEDIRSNGLRPTSKENLEKKLEDAVFHKFITKTDAETIRSHSVLNNTQHEKVRAGTVSAVLAPICFEDSKVLPLLQSWGGEIVHFGWKSDHISPKIREIGQPRVVCLSVSLDQDEIRRFSRAIVSDFLQDRLQWKASHTEYLDFKRRIRGDEVEAIVGPSDQDYCDFENGRWP